MGRGGILIAVDPATGIERLIKAQAYGIGFDLVGITHLGPAETAGAFDEWIDRGFSGDMSYLARGAEKDCRTAARYAPPASASRRSCR